MTTLPASVTNRGTIPFDQLPPPTVVEQLDFETVLAEMKTELVGRAPELTPVLALESEPASKILQACAYRVVIERQNANEKARRILLAKATGPELDHLGALPWILTPRKTIVEADPDAVPPVEAVIEKDDDYRARLQLALEGWSTAGPTGAYLYHALRADDHVKDVGVKAPIFKRFADITGMPPDSFLLGVEDDAGLNEPTPGDVAIAVLSTEGDGGAATPLLTAVETYLDDSNLRPTTDRPRAIAAEIINYSIEADIICYPGPDRALVLDDAQRSIEKYTSAMHRCGYDITISGIHNALHRVGVQKVNLTAPAGDIIIDWNQAAWCDGITLNDGGIDV